MTPRHHRLGPGTEFDLVRRMMERWGPAATGIGDDAAVLDAPGGRLVVSTDTSLEGVHFRSEWLSHHEAGYRATTAALSDLAAMAADPLGLLVALTLPARAVAAIDELADGIGEAAGAARCPIIGGDLTRGERLGLTITVLGTAGAPVTRSGARAGDHVCVTGQLGGPAEALRAWTAGREPLEVHRARFARPSARLVEARWLASHGAHALVDISDGLVGDLGHVAAASGVSIEVDLGSIPLVKGSTAAAAAVGGEEFELVAFVPDELDSAGFLARHGIPLTRIGTVKPDGAGQVVFLQDGRRVDLPRGYDHFSP